ncbi:MAG: glycosyltransferase [Planctomycetaceae bacterium]
MPEPDVSLVVPVRDEAGSLAPLVGEIRAALDGAGLTWEAIVVDDGSTDGSWAEIEAAARADGRIVGIRLEHGLGKSAALERGFARTSGRAVVMLDGDGQDDPAEIPRLVAALGRDGGGPALVNGWKRPRLDPWHKHLQGRLFNWLVRRATGLALHDHNCGLKAMHGDVARSLDLPRDMHRFIPALVWLGGRGVVELPVHHRPRTRGASKYGPGRAVAGLAGLWRVMRMLPASPRSRLRESRGRLRRAAYALFVAVAAGAVLGRIAAVASIDRVAVERNMVDAAVARAAAAGLQVDAAAIRSQVEREKRLLRPFLSANDRSRWLTIRALVERGTFAIEDLVVEPGWDSIDTVVHPDASGRLRLYSSKPPLLATLGAGPYWVLHRITGWTLGDHPFELGRALMILFGLVPLLVAVIVTCRLVEAVGTTDWGRLWAAALAAGGTFLTTFAVVLTNHVPAAACTAASAWLVHRIAGHGARSWATFAAAGLWAALAAACELPALAWLAAVLAIAARSDLRRTLTAALPAAVVVAAAALAATHAPHGVGLPPSAFRASAAPGADAPPAADGEHWNPGNWYDYRIRLPNGRMLESYWRSPQGVDRGEPSAAAYAWHVLAGHHGILSLTPAWLLVIPGLVLLHRRDRRRAGEADLATAIAVVSGVVLAFYLARPQGDRNYGGMTSGFRWVFWLAPLWVVAAVPAADRLARWRLGRAVGLALLALSVLSVAYPTWNPWTRPWIETWLDHAGGLGGR